MPLSTIPGHRVSFPAQAVATGNAANQPSFVSSPKSSVPLCANNANLRNLVPKGQKEMLVVFKELELVMSLGQANLSESDDSSDTEASFQVTLWCQMQLVICLYSAGLLEWRHWLLFVIYILVSTMSSIAMEQTTGGCHLCARRQDSCLHLFSLVPGTICTVRWRKVVSPYTEFLSEICWSPTSKLHSGLISISPGPSAFHACYSGWLRHHQIQQAVSLEWK